MPSENFEDEGLQTNPDLQIAQLRFLLTIESHKNDKKTKDDLLAAIKKESK